MRRADNRLSIKGSGAAVPAVLVHSTLAGLPVTLGLLVEGFLVDGRVSPQAVSHAVMVLVAVFICFFWSVIGSFRLKNAVSGLVISAQWVVAGVAFLAVYKISLSPVLLFTAVSMILLVTVFMLLPQRFRNFSHFQAGFLGLASVSMTSLIIWHGLGVWTSQDHALAARAAIKNDEQAAFSESGERSLEGAMKKNMKAIPSSSSGDSWTYRGESGPAMWGAMSDRFKLCATGAAQSPIDVPKRTKPAQVGISFDWINEKGVVSNNGQTIQVNLSGKSRTKIGEHDYYLRQFHFHTPSEHQLNGLSYPMEIHFSHAALDGQLAIVSVFVEMGASHPEFEKVIPLMPKTFGDHSAETLPMSLSDMIPKDRGFFKYPGSLTTPPCTENVLWALLATPVEWAPDQVKAFRKLYPDNSRPTQSLGARTFESQADLLSH